MTIWFELCVCVFRKVEMEARRKKEEEACRKQEQADKKASVRENKMSIT